MKVILKTPLHLLCDGMKGENYWTHGCMAYIAACLGLPEEYNYGFFNCYAGDSVTQVFSKDPLRAVRHLSHVLTEEGLASDFHAIGYSFTYVPDITGDTRGDWLPMIRDSIDRGMPVMARGGSSDELGNEFNCIVGFDPNTLYYLFCNKEHAEPVNKYEFTELVFIGEKISDPLPVSEGYKEALFRVPGLLTMPATDWSSFGVQALMDWADQLENGSLTAIPEGMINIWNVHGTYLCMLGSNGYGFGLYEKALAYHPELTWIHCVMERYEELQDIFETLAYRDGGVCGGFVMKKEDARDPEKMKPVCDKISRAAAVTEEIVALIERYMIGEK